VYPKERELPQTLLVDLEMEMDIGQAADSDDIAAAADYAQAARLLTDLAVQGRYRLIETYAENAVRALFDTFPRVETIRLETRKPFAVPQAAWAAVKIERRRPQ